MAEFKTKFSVGDRVHVISFDKEAVVGPLKIVDVLVRDSVAPEFASTRYIFRNCEESAFEIDVFTDYQSALAAVTDPKWRGDRCVALEGKHRG
jgi:hypothetical protein